MAEENPPLQEYFSLAFDFTGEIEKLVRLIKRSVSLGKFLTRAKCDAQSKKRSGITRIAFEASV